MVGTSGMSGQRVSPVTARQRSVPALMCGAAGGSEPEHSCTVPPSSAASASPPPLNTTSVSFGSVSRSLKTSSWICGVVPIGGVAQLNLSGFGFGERDKLLHRLRRQFRLDHEGVGRGGQFAHADEILERVIGDLIDTA